MQSPFAPKLLGQLGAERPGLAEIGFKSQLEKATTKSHPSLIGYSTAFTHREKRKNKTKQSY